MLFIDGVEYITDKQASAKYGLSQSWFKNARYKNRGPNYFKINGHIYYKTDIIDQWFQENLKIVELEK